MRSRRGCFEGLIYGNEAVSLRDGLVGREGPSWVGGSKREDMFQAENTTIRWDRWLCAESSVRA